MDGNVANQSSLARNPGGRLGAPFWLRQAPSSRARGASVLRPVPTPRLVAIRRDEEIWRGRRKSRKRSFGRRARYSSFRHHSALAFFRKSDPPVRSLVLAWNSSPSPHRLPSCQHSSCHGQRSRSGNEKGASGSAIGRMGFPTMECYRYTPFALTLRAGPHVSARPFLFTGWPLTWR
jgi:hypothetical protein